ncbi:hypothetical protein Avbf_14349, partial [Armadillidium vulgare]
RIKDSGILIEASVLAENYNKNKIFDFPKLGVVVDVHLEKNSYIDFIFKKTEISLFEGSSLVLAYYKKDFTTVFKMSSLASAWKAVRPHVPLIKFRKGALSKLERRTCVMIQLKFCYINV